MLPHKHYDPSKTTTYMVDRTTVGTLFAIAETHCMPIEHIDIKSAYLHEKFAHNGSETVYVKQPPRFNGTYKHQCQGGKPNMKIYGAPSAGHTYLTAVLSLLRKMFSKRSGPLPLVQKLGKHLIIAAVSMDYFTVLASTAKLKDEFAQALATAYNIKRLGEHQTFLGWTVQRHKIGDIHVSQPNAINYIVEQADMSQCNGKETPYSDGILLHKPNAADETQMDTLKNTNN